MRSLIFNVSFYGFTLGIAATTWLLAKVSTQNAMHRVLRLWGRGTLLLIRVILNSRVEVRGLERLPEGASCYLVSKHQSELDIVMLGALMPNTGAIAMAELTKYPFFGPILQKLDVVLVAVDQGRQGRTQQSVEGAKRVRADGRPMIIYPEGELMELGAKERYRKGAGHIYVGLDEPCYPVVASLGVIWPRRHWKKRAGVRGVIEFLEPIPPGLPLETFMQEIERRIEEGTMRLIRETAPPEVLAEAEDRHARGVNNHGVVADAEKAA